MVVGERAKVSGLWRSGDRDRRGSLDLRDRGGSQYRLHFGDILDLDRLCAYVSQRLLLVLQLLLLLLLLLGFAGLLIDGVELFVELIDAFIELLNARLDLLDAALCLSHGSGLLRDLLLPLLLGKRLSGHRNRRSRRIRLRRVRSQSLQLPATVG